MESNTNANTNILPSLKYRPDIDGLRAIAVLSVVGFHAFPHFIKGGFIGVDIFFVISGFLISTILFENLENNTFSFSTFYKKRIKRIFPALILVLAFCLTLGWFALFPVEYKELGKHVSGGAGFISNFLLWKEAGYFDLSAESKPMLHLWSLGIEEQFYILWPLLIWLGWKLRFNLMGITIFIVLLSFVFNIKGISSDAVATFYSPQTRFWELLSGSLLAYVLLFKAKNFHSSSKGPALKNAASIIGLAIIALCAFTFKKTILFPGFWALLPVLGAVLMIIAGRESLMNRLVLSHPAMIWVGLISYPLYLWHWPLLSFSYIMVGEYPNKIIRISAVLISIALAWLTYKFVEKPIRFGVFFERSRFATLPTLMLGLALCGGYIYQQNGFDDRYTELTKLHELVANPLPNVSPFYDGTKYYPNLAGILLSFLSQDKEPEVLFLGDSHASHYLNAIWTQFASKSVMVLIQPSCLPFSSNRLMQADGCKEKYQHVISFLQTNQSIKTIYLSSYWSYLMTGGFVAGDGWRNAEPLVQKDAQSFLDNARYFLNAVLKTDKEVVFLKDIPDLTFNIKRCFHVRPLDMPFMHQNKECYMDLATYKQRIKDYDKVISQLLKEFPQLKVYNPRPLFCQGEKCMARDDTLPFYANGDHLNQYGANIVLKDMREKLKVG